MLKKINFAAILLLQVPLSGDPITTVPPAISTGSEKSPAVPTAAPMPPKTGMNEMTGAILSVDSDPRVIRLTMDGGYNVEFSYDSKTAVKNGGHDILVADLSYGDKVIVRYIGKDLIARQIERTSQASPPAVVAPEPVATVESTSVAASTPMETPPSTAQ